MPGQAFLLEFLANRLAERISFGGSAVELVDGVARVGSNDRGLLVFAKHATYVLDGYIVFAGGNPLGSAICQERPAVYPDKLEDNDCRSDDADGHLEGVSEVEQPQS